MFAYGQKNCLKLKFDFTNPKKGEAWLLEAVPTRVCGGSTVT